LIIKYKYNGEPKKRSVPDIWKEWDREQRIQFLNDAEKDESERGFWGRTGSKTLDALALLERPAQALKVGLRETGIGGYDPTPQGFAAGFGKGLKGEDEVRTQEFLPATWNPIVKGILGFVGDVATDPLMYTPASVIKGIGSGVGKISGLTKGMQALGKLPASQALGRRFNVATTEEQKYLQHLERQRKQGSGTQYTDVIDDTTGLSKRVNHYATIGSPSFIEQWFRRTNKAVNKRAKSQRGKGKDAFGRAVESNETKEQAKKRVLGALMRYQELGHTDDLAKILGDEGVDLARTMKMQGRDILKLEKESGIFTPELQRQLDMLRMPDDVMRMNLDFIDNIHRAKGDVATAEAMKKYEIWKRTMVNPEWAVALDKAAQQYAYHALTPAGREKFIGSLVDHPGIGRTPFSDRTYQASAHELNALFASRHNYQNMFYENPVLAQALRMTDHHHNIQTAWMVDSISGKLAARFGVPHNTIGNWTRRINHEDEVKVYLNKQHPHHGQGTVTNQKGDWWIGRNSFAGQKGDNVPLSMDDIQRLLDEKIGGDEYANYLNDIKEKLDSVGMSVEDLSLTKFGGPKSDWIRELNFRLKSPEYNRPNEIVTDFNEKYLHYVHNVDLGEKGIFTSLYAPARAMGEIPTGEVRKVVDDPRFADDLTGIDKKVEGLEPGDFSQFRAPKEVSRSIDEYLDFSRNNSEMNRVKRLYDGVQNSWKGWTLAVRPAYHMRNLMGNITNAYLVSGVKNPKDYTDAMRMQWNGWFRSPDHLGESKKWVDAGGDPTKIASDAHWSKQGFSGMKDESMESIYYSGNDLGVAGGQYTKDVFMPDAEKLENLASRNRYGMEPGRKLQSTIGADSPAVRAGFKAGASLENNARWAVYINSLKKIKKNPGKYKWTAPDGKQYAFTGDKGEGIKAMKDWGITSREAAYGRAAEEVKKSLFDYLDVSKFERNVMKRVVPFYTWMRKNLPAQLEAAVKSPARMSKINIAREQFEFAGGRPEYKDIAPFWGNRVPIFFGKENQNVRQLFTLLNTLPTADFERLTSPADLITEMVSPIPKIAFEQLSNYDTFRQKPISTEGGFMNMLGWKGEMKDFLGIEIPANLWHIAQVLVPLAEINRLNPGDVFGTRTVDDFGIQKVTPSVFGAQRESNPIDIETTARWVRFFSGIRTYEVDIDRARGFKTKKLRRDLRALRTKFKYAASKGENRKAQEYLDLIDEIFEQMGRESKRPTLKSLPFEKRQERQLRTY
jgi:hypothetical protein